jgi:hypothetical protein
MKKPLRKLSLSRETVRTLEPLRVVGAGPVFPITGNTCDCTFSCPNLCPGPVRLTETC